MKTSHPSVWLCRMLAAGPSELGKVFVQRHCQDLPNTHREYKKHVALALHYMCSTKKFSVQTAQVGPYVWQESGFEKSVENGIPK